MTRTQMLDYLMSNYIDSKKTVSRKPKMKFRNRLGLVNDNDLKVMVNVIKAKRAKQYNFEPITLKEK